MDGIFKDVSFALLSDWSITLTLIFGGCCSNAITLEQLTSQYPQSGSLITFAQFLLISLRGLRKFVTFTPWPRLRPRRIPILPYLIQVALFYGVSLLNNAAFAYKIPMTVHIIFRSAGLVISMLMGWLIQGKRYTLAQVASVVLVTAGVVLTTLSASKPRPKPVQYLAEDLIYQHPTRHTWTYATGIFILTAALVLSGFLGLAQDKTYATYGRSLAQSPAHKRLSKKEAKQKGSDDIEPWQESMFYLHFLSMPLFYFVRQDIASQVYSLNASPTIQAVLPATINYTTNFIPISVGNELQNHASKLWFLSSLLALRVAYIPLILNTITQVVCVSGVHRLTSRVSSLTVTLVLVVRKAASLLVSVTLFGDRSQQGNRRMMWTGAAAVMLGTILYSIASAKAPKPAAPTKSKAKTA